MLLKKRICSLWDIVYHFICKIRFGGRFDAAMLESWFSRFNTGPTSVPVRSAGTVIEVSHQKNPKKIYDKTAT